MKVFLDGVKDKRSKKRAFSKMSNFKNILEFAERCKKVNIVENENNIEKKNTVNKNDTNGEKCLNDKITINLNKDTAVCIVVADINNFKSLINNMHKNNVGSNLFLVSVGKDVVVKLLSMLSNTSENANIKNEELIVENKEEINLSFIQTERYVTVGKRNIKCGGGRDWLRRGTQDPMA